MSYGSRNGINNEKAIVAALNGKRYKDLEPNMKTFITDLFGVVKPRMRIKACQTTDRIKPDIKVSIKKDVKFVSIKTATSTTLHGEQMYTLVPFFRECGMSEEMIKIFCLFQYGDGTYDGTGETRLTYMEAATKYKKQIELFNRTINRDHKLVTEIVKRVMFDGVDPEADKATYLYSGDVEFGRVISRRQVILYICNKSFGFYNSMHIGPIIPRLHARYASGKITNTYYHDQVDFVWPNLNSDVRYIYGHFSNVN